MSFFVAVLLRPDVQILARQELDAVIGRERLPTFEDRPRLPFVDAVCKEILRWRPVTPVGEFPTKQWPTHNISRSIAIPHATTKDDVYEGFFIPKGALA
jgi:Cytochrome P450